MITLGQFVQVFFLLFILGPLISVFDGWRGFLFAISPGAGLLVRAARVN
jgi:hypothetical protein